MRTIADMDIPELEAHIEALRAEIDGARCPPCRRSRLNDKIVAAQQRILRLRREQKLAEAKAAKAAAKAAEATGE